MSNCGCGGTWRVRYFWVPGQQFYEFDLAGFQLDNPTYQNVSGQGHIISSCDGRRMELVTFSFSSVTQVSFNWVPGPDCQPQSIPHDCINGACVPSSQYNTPGLYASLGACKLACGVGCGGKCLSLDDWSKIQSLANQLKNRSCN